MGGGMQELPFEDACCSFKGYAADAGEAATTISILKESGAKKGGEGAGSPKIPGET